MEKILGAICLILLFCSLSLKSQKTGGNQIEPFTNHCDFDTRMEELYELFPDLKTDLENDVQKMINKNGIEQPTKNDNCAGIVTIPVVFHYLYDANNLNDGYHSDNYIINNILGGMNSYFSQDNSADDNLPPAFQGTATDGTCIEFCLAQYDHPQNSNFYGNDLNRDGIKDADGDGIIDEGKFAINRFTISNAEVDNIRNAGPGPTQFNIIQGIASAWPVNEYLNIYVVPDVANSTGNGVTAAYTYLPNNGSAGFNSIYSGFSFANSGATMSHEVGHWLGLNHVWGGGCGSDDFYLSNGNFPINDTYDQSTSTPFGTSCNHSTDATVPMSCGSVDNIYNVMDYGSCIDYFTNDQAGYMYNTVTNLTTAGRNNFVNHLEQIKCQPPNAPIANFSPTSGNITVCPGESVAFTDSSVSAISWSWTFTGSALNTTITSTLQNPTFIPDQTGTITATLTASNSQGSDIAGPSTIIVTVLANGAAGCPPVNNECYGAIDISNAFPACPATFSSFGPYSTVGATSPASDLSLTGYIGTETSTTGGCCMCEFENSSGSTTELETTLWYKFTPSLSGNYLIEAIAQSSSNGCGATFGNFEDTQILIYESTDGTCNALGFYDCNEDGPSASAGLYPAGGTFAFSAGTTYYLIVDEYYANGLETGDFCLEIGFNGTCGTLGCTDPTACNFDNAANQDDGSCNLPDCLGNCTGNNTGPAIVGTACNDNDPCTANDAYNASCNCVGIFSDTDGDGVCDADDVCAGFDDNLIGTSCDDNDICTIGDTYDNSCNCVGIFVDNDNDGVCNANDVCANFDDTLIGTSCTDNNPCTINDTYDVSCKCVGTFQDTDSDGVCDVNDQCSGLNDALIGTACNDNNACTTNDVVSANCLCEGTFVDADNDGVCDANDVCAGFDDALIGTACDDNDVCTIGDTYDGSCNCVGLFTDSDNDGVCDANDVCDNSTIGTACDDNNSCTTSDVWDSSCNCVGLFTDSDNDGVCDANDACPAFDDNLIGTACDDNDVCTTSDTWDSNCNCLGLFTDSDSDGVCDANDVCPGFDDNLIGTVCNDGHDDTENDIWTMNCNCEGQPIVNNDECTLEIPLQPGWNLISTYCNPENPDMEVVFAGMEANVVQVKDLIETYVPAFGFNGIGDWEITSAYQVKILQADTLIIKGTKVDPLTNPIYLQAGWNLGAYFLEGDSDPFTVFSDLNPNVIQVKDLTGTYIPTFNFSDIGDLEPTQGFQFKLSAPDTLYYDPADIEP